MAQRNRIDPRNLSDRTAGTPLGTAVRNVLSLLVTAVGFVMTQGIDAVGSVFINPALGLGEVGYDFVVGFFGGPIEAFGGSWEYALASVTTGEWAFFGPATPIVITGSALGVFSLYLYWSDRMDVDVPTAGDIPFVGLDESGADEEN